jgi:hypothetical protein
MMMILLIPFLKNYIPFDTFKGLLSNVLGPAMSKLFGAGAFDKMLHMQNAYGKVQDGAIYLDAIERSGQILTHGVTPLHEVTHVFMQAMNNTAYIKFCEAASIKFGIPYTGGVASTELAEAIAEDGAVYLTVRKNILSRI